MKDLILGGGTGRVRIYLNVNTDADPVFDTYGVIVAAGLPLDVGQGSVPFIVDWNNDGARDLLVGEWNGRVYLLINTGTNASPLFPTKPYVMNSGAILQMGGYSAPFVMDLDRDGKKDLLCGATDGRIAFFKNVNTDEDPQFNGSTFLEDNVGVIGVGKYSRPEFADWDYDGFLDLLCGCSTGTVSYFHAIGPLALSGNMLSAGAGGSILLSLDAGVSNGNRNFLMLGSVTGTEPGTPLPGGYATLPLNWDPYTDLVLLLVNSPVFSNFMGKLNAFGQTSSQLNAPPLPSTTVGLVMHYSYCLNNMFDYVSNPAAIEVVP